MTRSRSHASSDIIPKKWLGQNFLTDPHVLQKICRSCQLDPQETILEIGPGNGALTKNLVTQVKEVIAIEKDKDLVDHLRKTFSADNLNVVHADFLKFPLDEVIPYTKIIGNLPYNVATPIISKILENKDRFRDVYIMVQLEYANRLAAEPGSKEYGSLSCFVQYHAEIKKLFKVKNSCFRPVPKVSSSFLHLQMRKKPLHPAISEKRLFTIIQSVFQKRRKTLLNAISSQMDKKTASVMLEKLAIDPKRRPEELSLEEFIKISNCLERP